MGHRRRLSGWAENESSSPLSIEKVKSLPMFNYLLSILFASNELYSSVERRIKDWNGWYSPQQSPISKVVMGLNAITFH